MKKRILTMAIAVVLVCSISAVMLAGCNDGKVAEDAKPTSYVALDINPSVALVLDQNNKVMSIKAENDDASVLLYGEDGIIGADINAATRKLGKLSADMKYINDDNKTVNVSVSTSLDTAGGQKLNADIEANIKKGAGADIKVITDGEFSLKREYEAFKKAHPDANVDLAKYRLMVEAAATDASIKIEDTINMSIDKLLDIVEDARDKAIDLLPKAEQVQAEIAEQAYELLLERAEASLYYQVALENDAIGTLDIGAHTNHIFYIICKNLELTLEDIEEAIDVAQDSMEEVLNSEEVDAIFAKLVEKGVITAEQVESEKAKVTRDGKVTLEAVEEYLDIKLKNASEDTMDAVEDALDATFDAIEERLDKIEDAIPDEVMTRLQNIKTEIKNIIDVEVTINVPAIKELINEGIDKYVNIDMTNLSKDIIEDLEEETEKQVEYFEGKVKEEMNKTEGLMDKYETKKANLPTDSKIAEAKATYDAKIKELSAKAEEYLKNAKLERKAK